MRTLAAKRRKPGLSPQPWPWGEELRVLVEHPNAAEGLRLATELRGAGYAVTVCPGPEQGARCPLVAGDGCAAAHGADVIVSALPEDRQERAEVRPMLRVRCADIPLIEASSLAPQHVVDAVADALSGGTRHAGPTGGPGPAWNPFRSERDAFRLVLATAVAFAAVAVAAVAGGLWPALGVWLLVSAVAAFLLLRRMRRGPTLRTAPALAEAAGEFRVLVAVHADPDTPALAADMRERAGDRRVSVHVVGLPHVSTLRRWTSDLDRPLEDAARVLERTLSGFRDRGLDASGTVGDDDPLRAIEDALRSFPADELVIVGAGRLDATALDAIAAAVRTRFALPAKVVGARS